MRPKYTFLVLGAMLLAIAGFVPNPYGDPTRWSFRQWTDWRDAEIQRLLQPTLPHGDETVISRQVLISRSAEAELVIDDCLDTDPTFFSQDKPLGRAMAHFIQFVKSQRHLASPDRQLGFVETDRTYLAKNAAELEIPRLLTSQSFLHDLADCSRYEDAVRLIEQHNASLQPARKWIVLPFLSQFIKSVDRTTYGRLLVVAPDQPGPDGTLVDKWVMFGIATPDMPADQPVRSVSIVTVRRSPTGSKAFLMDFLRDGSDQVRIIPTPMLPHNPSNACYDCHKTGAIPIKPEMEFAFDSDGHLVPAPASALPEQLERRIASYGKIELADIDGDAMGPTIGPAGRSRTDEWIRSAAGLPLSDQSANRIRSAMNCSQCHVAVGPINYPAAMRTSRDVLAFKTDKGLVQSYIEKGWMPPSNDLTPQERESLWRCVSKEYEDPQTITGAFVDWLKGG